MSVNTIIIQLEALIILLKTIKKVGKYLPLIVGGFATLNLLFAIDDFISGQIVFGIINSIFALGGFIFLVQLFQRRNVHASWYISQNKNME